MKKFFNFSNSYKYNKLPSEDIIEPNSIIPVNLIDLSENEDNPNQLVDLNQIQQQQQYLSVMNQQQQQYLSVMNQQQQYINQIQQQQQYINQIQQQQQYLTMINQQMFLHLMNQQQQNKEQPNITINNTMPSYVQHNPLTAEKSDSIESVPPEPPAPPVPPKPPAPPVPPKPPPRPQLTGQIKEQVPVPVGGFDAVLCELKSKIKKREE